jgi:hypothetical protein
MTNLDPCHCNTQRQDPDCHIGHTLSSLEADLAFPQRGQESNPNPMNARCGLEDCDCEYTIGGLLRRLELIAANCTAGLHPSIDKDAALRYIAREAKATIKQTRADHCDDSCACYVAGYESERRPC